MAKAQKQNVNEMMRLYREGWSYEDIGKKYGCAATTVATRLNRRIRFEKDKKNGKVPALSKDMKIKIEYLYMTGMDSLMISIRCNVPEAVISDYLENTHIGHLYDGRPVVYKKRPTEAQLYEKLKDKPCPFVECSGRRNCNEIPHPQECPIWKMYFEDDKKRLEKETLKKLLKV